jgi:hypothetical protein
MVSLSVSRIRNIDLIDLSMPLECVSSVIWYFNDGVRACVRKGPTAPIRSRTQYRFRLPPREGKPVAPLPLVGFPILPGGQILHFIRKPLSAFASVDPSPLPLRGFAVPAAAAEDLVSESPEAGRPLHSSRKPHNWALRCRGNSSRIPTSETIGRLHRQRQQIPHHSPGSAGTSHEPQSKPQFLKKSRFSSQSSCHSQWSDCSPLLTESSWRILVATGEIPHTETRNGISPCVTLLPQHHTGPGSLTATWYQHQEAGGVAYPRIYLNKGCTFSDCQLSYTRTLR